MEKNKLELNITWLYPKEMSTYGDRGNILTLKQRGLWRGIAVNIFEVGLKDTVHKEGSDLYFFGGGQDQAQDIIAKDLTEHKKHFLVEEAAAEKVFLGICGGYQLFGHYYKDSSGREIAGLGILDVFTIAGNVRMMGNIVVESELLKEKLVGFENHSGKTFLQERAKKLGTVLVGSGNNGKDRSEGAVENNVFGCYLHGPLLPKNPFFADFLLKAALKKRYGDIELDFLNDTLEYSAHEKALERSYKTR